MKGERRKGRAGGGGGGVRARVVRVGAGLRAPCSANPGQF